jgi:predicted O-methyltransferase YrrM
MVLMSAYNDIMSLLYGEDIWDGFYPQSKKMRAYNNHSQFLYPLIDELRPGLIVEIGSWYGYSALQMADRVTELGLDCVIVCIDTWLGSIEHWHERNRQQLRIVHGYPALFYQFLSNIVHAGRQDVILPMPMTSLCGLRWLLKYKFLADMVYIDGSHNEWDVYADVTHANDVLRPGGVMCGDDYSWPSVACAVQTFASEQGKTVDEPDKNFWIIR